MSKFYKIENETDSESSEEEVIPQRQATKTYHFSEEEEDIKRVVRSAKDKRFEEMQNVIRQLRNHKKIKDMSNVLTDFEALTKAFEKAKKIVDIEGMPRFYLRCLVELEDFVNECWDDKEGRKQMSKNNARGLTTLRQRLRRYKRDYEEEISKYRENPDEGDEYDEGSDVGDDDDDDDDDNSLSGDDDKMLDFTRKSDHEPVKPKQESSSDDDDDEWSEYGSDESSSDDDDYDHIAASFLKKPTADGKKEEKKKKKKYKAAKKAENEDEGEWEKVKGGIPLVMEKPKMFSKDTVINHEAVLKKLTEIISARGKKATDRSEMIGILEELLTVSENKNLGPAMASKIIFAIISAIYDYNPNIATNMKPEMWQNCLEYVTKQLDHLIENTDILVSENIPEDSENVETSPYRVRGCILTTVERMDEEFRKMLQGCDPHSTDYIERLKDERTVCDIIEKLQSYLEKNEVPTKELCRCYLRRIEHMYYKTDTYKSSGQAMDRLCKYIYVKDSTDRLRTRAILYHIYFHAIHDRWYEARDLMMMSHLQDTIQHSDIPTQIQYNRTMVQLGLCAFRQGLIKDAHNALVDILSIGRAKELLAQGLLLQRQHERTPEQELIEKRRQMPYHMHINLELLECVYLVSAMLIEIPYMAAHEFDARRRMISRNYHNLLRNSERQTLTGPPESMREHIVAASKAMKVGDWEACKNFVINEKMNGKVWDLFLQADKVRQLITQKIQEESLRTYLFTYSSVYDTLSMHALSEMFQLTPPVVHSIISKMILNEELMASLDEPTQTVVMHRTEPSRLQSLALQLSEKVANLVENNERILENKPGLNYYKSGYDNNQQSGRWNKRDNNQWNKRGDSKWGGRNDRSGNWTDREKRDNWKQRDRDQWGIKLGRRPNRNTRNY
ncbi:translation initiation factor 3 subunit C [Octopus vulgaris]|nr:eukaryotic translation initiation factor 3 subunit C [Octopus sinensis]CAI9724313.1 translation initiation factor 3 subunit C [Octopus vulgaris]